MSGGAIGQLKGTGGQLDIDWEIPDFLSLSAAEYYDSPVYFFGDTSWYVRVYPNSLGFIAIYLKRHDSGPPMAVTYSLFLKKQQGRKEVLSECKFIFKNKGLGHGNPKALQRSKLVEQDSEFLPLGTLTVICTLKFIGKREVKADEMLRSVLKDCNKCRETFTQTEADSDIQSKQLAATVQSMKVLCDYESLLLSGENCDVTLLVRGQKFEAHRAILCARSSVFASMLRHDMKEKNTGLICIEDCDPEYFPDFLRFLYCGVVEIITSRNACSLYRAGDKYDVQDLKSECLTFIESHLDVDNFCDVIALALQHREAGLVQQATDFFTSNMLRIVMTVEWQVFLHQNTTEGNELIIKAANKISNPPT